MRILTICPSNRPEKLSRMMDSFLTTRSESTEIRVNYEDKSITQIFNETFQKCPNYDFYHMTNDDVIYRTENWDVLLAKKGKITYGNDLFQGKNLCAFPMIDGDIVRALGWIQMPKLERYAGDVIWKFIGDNLGIIEYVPEVIIEHKWEGCSDIDMNNRDMKAFAEWIPWAFKDMEKIRKVIK